MSHSPTPLGHAEHNGRHDRSLRTGPATTNSDTKTPRHPTRHQPTEYTIVDTSISPNITPHLALSTQPAPHHPTNTSHLHTTHHKSTTKEQESTPDCTTTHHIQTRYTPNAHTVTSCITHQTTNSPTKMAPTDHDNMITQPKRSDPTKLLYALPIHQQYQAKRLTDNKPEINKP